MRTTICKIKYILNNYFLIHFSVKTLYPYQSTGAINPCSPITSIKFLVGPSSKYYIYIISYLAQFIKPQ
jgi:hypothetical protein